MFPTHACRCKMLLFYAFQGMAVLGWHKKRGGVLASVGVVLNSIGVWTAGRGCTYWARMGRAGALCGMVAPSALLPEQAHAAGLARRKGWTRWTRIGRWACRTTAVSTAAYATSWLTCASAPSASWCVHLNRRFPMLIPHPLVVLQCMQHCMHDVHVAWRAGSPHRCKALS